MIKMVKVIIVIAIAWKSVSRWSWVIAVHRDLLSAKTPMELAVRHSTDIVDEVGMRARAPNIV